jgi:polygalacturonase
VPIDGLSVSRHKLWVADGIDIDSCHRVRILNSTIQTRDDAIALKTTSPRACRDIHVENSRLSSIANAFKIGTETTGNFENITLKNSTLFDTGIAGIALFAVDGGMIQNVRVSDVVMENVKSPIFLRLGNRARHYLSTNKAMHRHGGELPEGFSEDQRPGVG